MIIMLSFDAILLQFAEQGEKTGWTYIEIPEDITEKLKPGNKKSFRVKGKLDDYNFKGVALLPMGDGKFIMAINAAMRKAIHKRKGAVIKVQLAADNDFKVIMPKDFAACLDDEPRAKEQYYSLPLSHQHYYIKWIESAKTTPTRVKRIALAVKGLSRKLNFGEMMRMAKEEKLF